MPLLYATTAMAFVVVVIAVAYGSQSPSLAVAEFSPTARQGLQAPPTTGGDQASGGATGGRRTTTTTAPDDSDPAASGSTTPGPGTSLVGRGRQCFGNPPRQTSDPQSPACQATMFEGDNGGATSVGVTATEIRVALRQPSGSYRDMVQPMFDYFNRHFEFYGRKLVPVFLDDTGNQDPAKMRAAAADMAAQSVFAAVTPYTEWAGGTAMAPFYGELARSEIITILDGKGRMFSDATLYDANHPYLWGVFPSAEQLYNNVVDFSCSTLAGKAARFAGEAGLREKTRKFGILAYGYYSAPKTSALARGLADCSGTDAPVAQYVTPGGSSTQMQTALSKLREAGVTTLVCACEDYGMYSTISALNTASFGPELLNMSSSTPSDEIDFFYSLKYAPGVGRPFGITERPKQLPWQGQFWFQALQETGQSLLADLTVGGKIWDVFLYSSRLYPQLMVLASGIQSAGPQLSADTFAQGLMSAQFPNEAAGAAPYYQPSVGFGPGDHSFYNDYAFVWWSDEAKALDPYTEPYGSWCYVGQGTRASVGGYAADLESKFFDRSAPCT